jgi:LytTr DNA-binding domain
MEQAMRLVQLLHQRFIGFTNGFTNGNAPLVQHRSAAAQLAAAGALLVLALTLVEPASAFGMPWWQRAGFYAASIAPAMLVAWWASGWLFNRPALQRWPAWTLLALAGAVAGAALAPWSVTLEMALGVVDLDEPLAAPLPATAAAWWAEVWDELLRVPPRTALFWMAMNFWVLWRVQPREPEAMAPAAPGESAAAGGVAAVAADAAAETPQDPAAPEPPLSTLLDRLPARLGRDVVQLEAQQHYLRVVTTRGEHLLLHGLSPAVAELAQRGIAGMQIHRSTWVAWSHVERLDLRPGSLAAVLRDGRRLPIGRRRVREVARAWQQWPGA